MKAQGHTMQSETFEKKGIFDIRAYCLGQHTFWVLHFLVVSWCHTCESVTCYRQTARRSSLITAKTRITRSAARHTAAVQYTGVACCYFHPCNAINPVKYGKRNQTRYVRCFIMITTRVKHADGPKNIRIRECAY